ncbi:MAG TPA: sulfotransferase [Rhodanobacteraceae bacterium]|nr:sulfotransferase [Rhodanobacteraceae bacterium]
MSTPVKAQSVPLEVIVQTFQQGRFREAEAMARAHLAVQPDVALAANVLGLSMLNQGRARESVDVYARLVERWPNEASYWNNLGTALRNDAHLDQAQDAYTRALRLQPRNAQFLANMGFLQMEWKRIVKAKEYLLRACEIDPEDFEARVYCAQMCLECGEEQRARDLLASWREWEARLGGVLRIELGAMLLRLSENDEGEALLRRHLDDPEHGAAARARLVLMLERFNRMEEARTQLALLPPPESVAHHELRGEILEAQAAVGARDRDVSHARGLLETLLKDPAAERGRTTTWFALAKLCDKQGDYAACMEYLRLAHESQLSIAAQLVPELMEPSSNPLNIANFYVTAGQFEAWKPAEPPAQSPIFVLGFPRSGTTMLEQMLDAHPGMVSMDERPFIQRVIERMQSMGLQYPEQLGDLDTSQCNELREVYWKAVAEVVQLKPGQTLVDKNPLTMLRLPLLVRLFPSAKIIFAVRHPCDVVLSNYMQHFNAPAYVALCSTLPRLAAGYAAAMRFWHAHVDLLKPQVFEWKYEDAVHDFDGNVLELGAFLELEDTSPLHGFSEHARRKGYIGTPSYAQVVQPVYSGSIGRWHPYREYFEPVLHDLEPAMRHWGYEA